MKKIAFCLIASSMMLLTFQPLQSIAANTTKTAPTTLVDSKTT